MFNALLIFLYCKAFTFFLFDLSVKTALYAKTNWLGVKPPMFCKSFDWTKGPAKATSVSEGTSSNVLLKTSNKTIIMSFYNIITKL